jgi:hypothetical protein
MDSMREKEYSDQHGQHEGEMNILINMDNMREKGTFWSTCTIVGYHGLTP